MGVAVDVDGILYIADSGNDAIRRIQLGGKVRSYVCVFVHLFSRPCSDSCCMFASFLLSLCLLFPTFFLLTTSTITHYLFIFTTLGGRRRHSSDSGCGASQRRCRWVSLRCRRNQSGKSSIFKPKLRLNYTVITPKLRSLVMRSILMSDS